MKALLFTLFFLPIGTFAQAIPDFAFQKLDGVDYSADMLPKNKAVLIYYFDPNCDACAEQVDLLMGEKLSDVTMLFVSMDDSESVDEFARLHMPYAPNIIVAKDLLMMFDSLFGYAEFGTLFCYNSQHQLVEKYTEPTSVNTILKALH